MHVDTVGNFLEPLHLEFGLFTDSEWRRIYEINPDLTGSRGFKEVITWAVHDIAMVALAHFSSTHALERVRSC